MTTTTINPTTSGLSTAELETELLSELPEREEMSSAFRFVSNHPGDRDYRFIRVWDERHHRFIIERVIVITSIIHFGRH